MIALHMLVKNEEVLLPRLLNQVKPFVTEMVIVLDDTSIDRTEHIALSYGALVLPYRLNHDFAAARNHGLAHITQPWVLWMDADERLSPELTVWLRRFLKGSQPDCLGIAFRRQNLIDNAPIGAHTYEWHVRLFRNHLRCEGRIHERIKVTNEDVNAAPPECLLFHHKTHQRQEMRNVQYMEWPEQRRLVNATN